MALLSFPTAPINGQIYPINPPAGTNVYSWSSPDQTWRLLGTSTGVAAGCYGDSITIPTFCVDSVGRITSVTATSLVAASWTAPGELVVGTGVQTQTILSPGVDTSVLVVDSTTTSGLAWSDTSQAAALMPVGTSAARPSTPTLGQLRYNSDIDQFEGYQGATPEWIPLSTMPTGGIPAGGSPEPIFYINSQVVTEDYTVPAANNAISAGPITVNAGVTVTVSAGSAWSIV